MGALETMREPEHPRGPRKRPELPRGLNLELPAAPSEARWRAVAAHDCRFDGDFVYAVRSTGVSCRPSCPSRRPRREQVVFFALPAAAERAGFRPCRRCKPRDALGRHPHAALVERACRAIQAHRDEPLKLAALGDALGLSPFHLQRTFKRLMGVTPREYADALRLGGFKAALKEGKDVTTALYEAGYGSSSRLYERSSEQLGMTPGAYRRGGEGMQIRYTIVDCPLRRLLVGATERGVSSVCIGDSDAPLEAALREEYPNAAIEREKDASGRRERRQGLGEWVKAIVRHLEGSRPHLDLPVDVQATAFQRRVWRELTRIPYGATRSYGQVARAIGNPKAVRAVGHACATNPVAVVIPCHRVVRGDGSLGGYRWGLERKEAILKRESANRTR